MPKNDSYNNISNSGHAITFYNFDTVTSLETLSHLFYPFITLMFLLICLHAGPLRFCSWMHYMSDHSGFDLSHLFIYSPSQNIITPILSLDGWYWPAALLPTMSQRSISYGFINWPNTAMWSVFYYTFLAVFHFSLEGTLQSRLVPEGLVSYQVPVPDLISLWKEEHALDMI